MGKSTHRSKALFLVADAKAVVAAAASRSKPIDLKPQAMGAIAKALNASIQKHPTLLCPQPEALRIVREMWTIEGTTARLMALLSFSKTPILSPRHGSEEEIVRRAARRAESLRQALAVTAGSGSLDVGYSELRHALEVLEKVERWASATAHHYSQTPEYLRTQFPGRRRQGDHRPIDRLAFEAFVFDALRAYEQVIGRPGNARVGGTSDRADTLNSPAIRYLDEIFNVIRKKVARGSDLTFDAGKSLSPKRASLAYLIRKYNKSR
jgi:hypothetical protein